MASSEYVDVTKRDMLGSDVEGETDDEDDEEEDEAFQPIIL